MKATFRFALIWLAFPGLPAASESEQAVTLRADPQLEAAINYSLKLSGRLLTPSDRGEQSFDLTSTGMFTFTDRSRPTELGGPFTVRAVRKFSEAGTTTTVGKDHTTSVSLASAYRIIHVFGSEDGLISVAPRHPLPRKQLDLLQMPFDPRACDFLLPVADVIVGDRWNTEAWVVPMLTGTDVVVSQQATCELKSLNDDEAIISVTGRIEGATLGSVTNVEFSGTLVFDRQANAIRSLDVVQQEKRSAGPVSPGLDVTARITWQQKPSDSDASDVSIDGQPTEAQRLILLQTPLKLQLLHSREWHLFHETPNVIMLRQLRHGNLISQCNISHTVTVPPGQHTSDREFAADVKAAVADRKGQVIAEDTIRNDAAWRMRHVRAVGQADQEPIIWDYYLCTAASGHQFSLVFSHSKRDEEAFGDSAQQILNRLQPVRRRPALPFR